MTRAIDRLIVSGAIDPTRTDARRRRSAGCSAGSSSRGDRAAGRRADRARARRCPRRRPRRPVRSRRGAGARRRAVETTGSSRCSSRAAGGVLPPIAVPAAAARGRCRRRRCTASAGSRTQCARAVRALLVPLLRRADRRDAPSDERLAAPGTAGLAATEIGDAVHRLLELVDLREPPRADARRSPQLVPVGDRRGARTDRRASSPPTATRPRAPDRLAGERPPERPFAFEHDGVLAPRAARRAAARRRPGARRSTTRPTRSPSATPEEIVEADYRLQRLVYALACFRAGARRGRGRLPVPRAAGRGGRRRSFAVRPGSLTLEAELSAAIARIDAGDFRPTPSEFACAGCPALDVVCAGPRLPRRRLPPRARAARRRVLCTFDRGLRGRRPLGRCSSVSRASSRDLRMIE